MYSRYSTYNTMENEIDILQYNSEENIEQTPEKPKRKKNSITNGINKKSTRDS